MYYLEIFNELFRYADIVENSNPLSLSDEATDAESVFYKFYNKAFGWQLINANEGKKNQAGFDLIDRERKIAVQITSDKKHLLKFNHTLASFKLDQENKKINGLIIFFITGKCPASILKKTDSGDWLAGFDR